MARPPGVMTPTPAAVTSQTSLRFAPNGDRLEAEARRARARGSGGAAIGPASPTPIAPGMAVYGWAHSRTLPPMRPTGDGIRRQCYIRRAVTRSGETMTRTRHGGLFHASRALRK